MRIGIDARFYGPIGKGLGRYTERLIQNLEQVAADHEFVIFLRKENFDSFQPRSSRFRKVLADFGWYSAAEQFWFPPLIAKEGIDLMHFPHFNVPVLTPCPFVVTIHDLILFRFPTRRATTLNPITYAIKYAAYRLVISLAVRRARKIITVSECTKRDIQLEFRVAPEKIVVTYEAADPSSPETSEAKPLPRLNGPYFLYVGNAYPHKNLDSLLKAFKELRDEGLNAQLVLVGKSDYFYDRLRESAESLGLLKRNDVVFAGFVEDADLAGLYRNARSYVFPSLLEGFGLPPLEAMRFGTPVAAAGNSCLPEILGEAATYFDPRSIPDMKRAMRQTFADESVRADLATKGRERVREFSWARCAEETYLAYVQAINR